jgi:hypothetical protein
VSLLGGALQTLYPIGLSKTALLVAGLSLLGALREFQLLPLPVPSTRWQVPQRWKIFPPTIMAGCFGFMIGLGVLTAVPYSTFYIVLAACLLIGDPFLGILIMALHALAQSLFMLFLTRSYFRAPDRLAYITRVANFGSYIPWINAFTLGIVGVFLATQFILSR